MAFFEDFTVDQLNRLLSLSRWGLGVFAVLTAGVGVLNQYITDKIAIIQKADKEKASIRQREAENTLAAVRVEAESAKKLAANIETRQRPRVLPDELINFIKITAAQHQGKNDLLITCVVGDPEAWALAEQIQAVFVTAGFHFERIAPVISFPPVSGLSLSAQSVDPSPLHACLGAIMKHFDAPMNAKQAKPDSKPWTLNIGMKP